MTTEDKQLNRLQLGIWISIVAILAYGIYQVIQLYWVCDDAFISYRYAKNLASGLGLVFNAGEHVEGYTNFLWTVIVALGFKLNFEPIFFSNLLAALSFFGTIVVFAWASYRLFCSGERGNRVFLPITALAILLHHDCQVFATSGLETSFNMLLVSLGFVLLLQFKNDRTSLWAGLALVLAATTRPDSMAFLVMGAFYLLLTHKRPSKSLLWYLAPLVLLYLPYWIIRYNYYGWPFPNTYYAKSANLPYYSQGIKYVALFFESYYVLLLAPIGLTATLIARRTEFASLRNLNSTAKALLLSLLFCGPYLFYVLRSGGDFMFARFFIPVVPLLFLMVEIALRTLVPNFKMVLATTAIVLAMVLLRWDPFTTEKTVDMIADEHQFYPDSWVQNAQKVGADLKRYFEGTNARSAFRGMFAMYVYYSEIPVAIEGQTGLTDEYIAHMPITTRGRPGHEKLAPMDYLYQRQVNFYFRGGVKPVDPLDSLACIYFNGFPTYIITFDNELMDHLKQFPDVQFRDVRPVIDDLITEFRDEHEPRALLAYPFLKTYYFNANHDPDREKWFIEALQR